MNNWPQGCPIYYVVVERAQDQMSYQYGTYTILRSIPCDIADIEQMYGMYVAPLQTQGRSVQSMIFRREPENPMKEQAQSEGVSS